MYQQTQPQAFTTLSDLGVVAIYCTCEDEAHKLIDEMAVDAGAWPVGVDFETTPLPSETARLAVLGKDLAAAEGNLRALRLCRALPARIEEKKREVGRLKAAIKYISSASLDPHRSSIRLLQLYGGGARAAVIDLHRAGAGVLDRLNGMRLVAHNAQFELSFLHHYGVEPDEMHCTMQAAALLDGTDRRRLEIVAANRLGVTLDKALQTSNWGAPNLTAAQIEYAGLDAVVCFKLGRVLLPQLGPTSAAYEIQMTAIPAVVRMQHRGFHIDTAAHGRLLDALRHEMEAAIDDYAGAAAAASLDATLQVLPSTPGGKRELLEALLDGDELASWQRTPKSGELSTTPSRVEPCGALPADPGTGEGQQDRKTAGHIRRELARARVARDRADSRLLSRGRRGIWQGDVRRTERPADSEGQAFPGTVCAGRWLPARLRRLFEHGIARRRPHLRRQRHDGGIRSAATTSMC